MILSYIRVSTVEQVEGTSPAEQERKNWAIAQLRGAKTKFDVSAYVDDGVSGSIPLAQRPEGQRLLADAKAGDVVIASKLDRLFRSAIDALTTTQDLQKRGVDVILADISVEPLSQSATAQLFFTLLAAFAQFERSKIHERTTDGRRAKKARNGHIGGLAPYGYRKVGEGKQAILEPIEEEQQVLELARTLAKQGRLSYVTRELNRRGLRTRTGREFQFIEIQRMCRGRKS